MLKIYINKITLINNNLYSCGVCGVSPQVQILSKCRNKYYKKKIEMQMSDI